jgi:hypothetical protein
MRYELRTIGVWSFVRVSFLIHLVLGFILGVFGALFLGMLTALMSSLPYGSSDSGVDPTAFGPAMLIILPVVYSIGAAVFGTIFTAIMAVVYNLIVKMVGGVEFELEPTTLTYAATAVPPSQASYTVPTYTPPPPPDAPAQTPPPAPPKFDWTPPPNGRPGGSEPEKQ